MSAGSIQSTGEPAAGPARRRILALIANLLVPPLGHIYLGAARRGLFLWVGVRALAATAILLVLLAPSPLSILALWGAVATLVFALPIDAFVLARRLRRDYAPRPYNRWYVYVASAALFLLPDSAFRNLVWQHAQAFRVPSGSMAPTLLAGDFFLVRKASYLGEEPRRGDVIAFRYPRDPTQIFVDRIVGLPDEVIEIRSKRILVNGVALEEPHVMHADSVIQPAESGPRDHFGPLRLGPRELFLMGDHRDNSNDSRYWGPAARTDVIGKAVLIYWSWDGVRSTPRWNRVGRRIE